MTAHVAQKEKRGLLEYSSFGDVCLLGLGVTGRAVLDYFLSNSERFRTLALFGISAKDAEALKYFRLPSSVTVHVDEAKVTGTYDLAIASPGIPPHNSLYASAKQCAHEIISEPELAWRIAPERWIGITGTNGKTTTTALVVHVLETGGLKARAAGNIGTPCIEAVVQRSAEEYIVAELSSYQLYSCKQFAPDAVILLGISADHLSWHGSYEAYEQAKLKILEHLDPQNPAVIDAMQETTRKMLRSLRDEGRRVIGIGTTDGLFSSMVDRCGAPHAAFVSPTSHVLTVALDGVPQSFCHAADLKVRGTHNLTNALAAATVARELGVSQVAITESLSSFEPLEHRFEPCGEVDGVRFYNDSKATNIDATIRAVEAFGDDEGRRVITLFGGRDKGTDLAELVTACSRNCRRVICYGEAADRFYEAFSACDAFVTSRVAGFEEACAAAAASSVAGDVVLLSPACASFDEFSSFEARGTAFKNFVINLCKQGR